MSKVSKQRVLIADDEVHIRSLMKRILLSMGLDVAGEAENGQQAIDLYKKESPDLLLLDINMPHKRGDEALSEIMKEFPMAKIVMLTSVNDMETVKKCIDNGAVNYILKNNPLPKVREMIKTVI